MKKYMKILLIVVIAAAMCVGVISVVKDSKAKSHAPVVYYSESYGGDMTGGHSLTRIRKLDGEKAMLFTSEAEWHNQPSVITESYVPASVLTEIESVFDRYKMYTFDNLPEVKEHALDAGATHYSFSFEDGDSVSFDSEEQIPSKAYDGLREIREILRKAAEEGERLPGLVTEQPEDEESYIEWYTPDEIGLTVFEYSEGKLYYRLSNGTEDVVTLEGQAKLYRLDGETRQEIDSDANPDSINVYARHFDEEYIRPEERLEAGSYLLVFGELEDGFEIR